MTQRFQRFSAIVLTCVALLATVIFYASYSAKHRGRSTKMRAPDEQGRGASAARDLRLSNLKQSLAQLPLSFEENRGQFDPRVKFLSRGAGYGLFLSSGQATIIHHGETHITGDSDASSLLTTLGNSEVQTKSITQLTWIGANPNAQPRGAGHQGGESNYLIGKDPRKWRRHVRHYDRVQLAGLYPGIDLVYHGAQQQVEMDYVVAPHADPKAVQIGISGPSLVSIDGSGQLSISSAGDELQLLPPVAYQEKDGHREIVQARYVLAASHQVGFELGAYDTSRPLIIDPVLTFAATFGTNTNSSIVADVALDSTGNIYITGTTCDTNYPTTSGAFEAAGGSNTADLCNDAIVTKLNPSASELLYSTYIGGQVAADFATRVLVDGAGEATIVGNTASSDFPTTSGAYQTSLKSGTCDYSPFLMGKPCTDAFLLKLSADGSSLVYSTLFGGERVEMAVGLAQDSAGDSYIAGATNSSLMPVTNSSVYGGAGSCQGGQVPCFDGFIAKIKADGSQLLASTYIGGNDDDFVAAVALDSSGNVYLTGTADSTNFPVTSDAFQPTHAPGLHLGDAFLARFDGNLQTLQYSTFFGGSGEDIGSHLRLDSSGAAYIIGSSLSSDLPTTTGAYQTAYKGAPAGETICIGALDATILAQPTCGDAFLAKIDTSKTGAAQLIFSTYLGGSASDFAYDFVLDSQNNAWLIGNTNSPDFPVTGDAYFSTGNLFLSEIKNDGTQLLFSTFLSRLGSQGELGLGVGIDPSDDVYVAGQGTVSPTPGTYTSGTNLFVMKFAPGTARPSVQLSATSLSFGTTNNGSPLNSATAPQSVTLMNNGTATLHLAISITAGFSDSLVFNESDNCGATVEMGASCTINATYEPSSSSNPTGIDGATIQIIDDAPGAPHSIALDGRTGLTESASFLPSTLTFTGQQPGSVSASQMSFLSASETSVNSLSAITTGPAVLGGPNTADFTVDTSNCGAGVSGCFLTVTFTPAASATGTRTATVSVPTTSANSPQVLNLSGTVSATPFIQASNVFVSPTQVGITQNTSFIIMNIGGAPLTITGLPVTGPNASDFVVTFATCSLNTPILPQASPCLFNLAFTPSAHGERNATLTFTDNETTQTTVPLMGYGSDAGGPQIVISTLGNSVNNQLIYPDTQVGHVTNFNQSLVSIINDGIGLNAGAHITSAVLTGDFTQTNTCPGPTTLFTGGASCTYTVLFAPTAAGLRTGTLTITTDAPGGQTLTANFAGNGVLIPTVNLAPASLNFGSQAEGTTTAVAQTATLTNAGNGALNLSAPTVTGPFTLTTNCGLTLAANASCGYSFKFVAPSVAGPSSGTLTATTNAAGGMLAIGLTGTAVTGPVAQAQPASLTFGSQPINSISPSQPVTFTNVGDTAFTIAGVRASENFRETNNCPSSLGAGVSCTINISLAPTTDVFVGGNGGANGNVFVTMSAPGSPFAIPVVGTATNSTGAATNLVISSSQNPSTAGQPVTFTATVTPTSGSGTPTGAVTFFGGGGANQLGLPVTLSAGKAMFTTSALPTGVNSITINYGGDATFAPENSSGFVQDVTAAANATTTTAIVSSLNPSTVGQSVTFTATVTSGTAGTITGTVTFFDGATQIGSPATLSGGSAAVSTSALTQASHSITAQYSGDTNYATSTSSPLTQVVNAASKAATSTSVASSQNPSGPGASVTFTATVTTISGTPTGAVAFIDGVTTLGMGTLSGGHATFTTSSLAGGSHSITASYGGDANFIGSLSTAITQVVLKATTTTEVSSLNPSMVGQSVMFTATVASSSGTPTGTVNFVDGIVMIGSGTLNGQGVATFSTTTLAQGVQSITAQYLGDANFNGSTSTAVSQTVNGPGFSVTVQQTPITLAAGQSGMLSVTVTPQNGSTQTVTLTCNGLPAQTTCASTPVMLGGTNPVVANVTVQTTVRSLTLGFRRFPLMPVGPVALFWLGGIAILALATARSRRPYVRVALTCGLFFLIAAGLTSCASGNGGGTPPGGSTGTPAGTFSVTVTGTSGSASHTSAAVSLTVN